MAKTRKEGVLDQCIQASSGNTTKETKKEEGNKREATKSLRRELIPSFKTEKQVCEFLKSLCGSKKYPIIGSKEKKAIQIIRMSSGVTRMGNRVLRFGKKGMADFLLFGTYNSPVWVECKAPGKTPSPDQLAFAVHQEQEGIPYYCFDGNRVMFVSDTKWLQDKEDDKQRQYNDFRFDLIKKEKGGRGWYAFTVKRRKDLFNILINRCENVSEEYPYFDGKSQ